jgi:hypothetical protein
MGAATRRMISAPAPSAQSNGNKLAAIVAIVINFGLRRSTVPSVWASTMSSREWIRSLWTLR